MVNIAHVQKAPTTVEQSAGIVQHLLVVPVADGAGDVDSTLQHHLSIVV